MKKTECGPGWCRSCESALNRVFGTAAHFWPALSCRFKKQSATSSRNRGGREKRFGFEKCCTDWRDIVNDPEIDVVSVTPNNVRRNRHRCAERRGARTLRKADRLDIGGREGHGGGRKESGAKGIIARNLPVQARSGDRPR